MRSTLSLPVRSVLLAATLLMATITATAQPVDVGSNVQSHRAPAAAAAMSLVLPGLGQRYANGGSWNGAATVFALADVAVWLGLYETVRTRNNRIDTYEALAVSRARADVDGKDRTFFLNLATFRSSDEYLEVQLRNRAWDQLDYVSDPSFQWEWEDEEGFLSFRDLRGDSESLGRRKSALIAALVANRIVSALVAVRAASRSNKNLPASLSLGPPARGGAWPSLSVRVDF
ncbi:MAG: hypothetical protein HKN37_06080 [Rhodothermales bacterium]|nr:hypothetical protein [Rhodothermales bacterium]